MGSNSPEEDEMTPEYVLFDHSRDIADQVAEWLAEAADTLAALPATGTRPSTHCVKWPDVVFDPEDLDWFREMEAFMPPPTAEQIRRMDIALGWLSLIDASHIRLRRVINMRLIVHPISGRNRWGWEKIAGKLGVAEPTAKRWHRLGCEAIGKKIASR